MKILAFMEAATVTGPAKNLLEFGQLAAPAATLKIATFRRPPNGKGREEPGSGAEAVREDLFLAEVERAGLPVAVLTERHRADWEVAGKMQSIAREFGADIVQTHGVKSHFLWAWGMRWAWGNGKEKAGLPLWVAWHHGYTQPSWKQRLYNEFDRWSLPRAHAVVTVTRAFAQELADRGVRREAMYFVGNSVWSSPCWSSPSRGPFEAAERTQEPLVLGVGRLSREKNFRLLIDAVSQLQGQVRNLRVVIAGEGPERSRLQEQARQAGVSLELPGHVPNLEPYWAKAAVYVCSSRSEGSPNAVLEAMAHGVPVVATAVGGVPEMIEHGKHGFLCSSEQPGEMAAWVQQVLSNQQLAESFTQAARERVEREFSPTVRTAAILRLYEELFRTKS